ncbi:homocysteine S-methyltransferase family protein [Profundibacterium mesophilum]|uniref:Homocysteine S-methyltransferase n=1 Tax=Profundibacterium mesophilum KAUST100406-0324 TaxID=1037889 RepID=A0A921NQ12_9RHOB|nr:homocysteine S-methyltransferase family protein [Profundibacterium mesophilum]KAF0676551.1 homocysteine S-methyltransferase [Profundibacterium mesophilum KAUST100406-0324]
MDITLLDGGMGQELIARHDAPATPLWSTSVMMDAPELVRAVHDDFFAAGATIATTNSYALHADRLDPAGLGAERDALIAVALRLAAEARNGNGGGRIAGSIGPLGASYRPDLGPPVERTAALYEEMARKLAPGCDIILAETLSSVEQATGALQGSAKASLPVWIGLTVKDDDGTRLRSGEPLEALLEVLEAHPCAAVMLNCSRPEAIAEGLPVLARTGRAFGAYANGFTKISEAFLGSRPTVDMLSGRTDLGPEAYADHAMSWIEQGASIVGGCCEVGPAHIAALAERLRAAGHRIV